MTTREKVQMTAADFVQLTESNQIRELIEGELLVPASPSDEHQDVVPRVWQVVNRLINKSGKVKIAPQDLYLDVLNVPQPDIFWGGSENSQCQLDAEGHWRGAPELVVEVISPSTEKLDRGKKYYLYERHGVREYWLVHPLMKYVEVYVLLEGSFKKQGFYEYGIDEKFTSPVLYGQEVLLKEFFEV